MEQNVSDTSRFPVGFAVIYVPYHAHGDTGHPDCELGEVTSTNEHYVFVRFSGDSTSQACKPDQLVFA